MRGRGEANRSERGEGENNKHEGATPEGGKAVSVETQGQGKGEGGKGGGAPWSAGGTKMVRGRPCTASLASLTLPDSVYNINSRLKGAVDGASGA